MCRSCNAFSWSNTYSFADNYGDVVTSSQLAALGFAASSLETALAADGVGDGPAPTLALVPTVVTVDNVPDGITGTNPTVTVGGPHIISTIDTPGDQDFYAVQLEAGVKYNIGMYGHPGGPSGVAQFDSYIELYDAAGTKIGYEDGKGRTPSGELYGLDAMLTITVATTGTYYINARAFEQGLPTDSTTTGDTIGDYDLFVEVNTDPPEPVDDQYYPMTSPLRSIDWGTQVDGTVRNPDGNEGTAPTGNPAGTPDNKGATVGYWGQSTEGKNVIKIYFAKAGDVYTPEDPTSPGIPPAIVAVGAKDFEVTAIWISLREFEKVADVVYVETQNRDEADFHYVTYSGTPGPGISLLGSMNPPQEADEGLAQFNSGDERWNATNLAQGGFSFVTLIHEFGHGHGLAHPHDNGGNSTIMPGVKGVVNSPAGPVPDPSGVYPNYTRGDHDLNQGVFTMMSYQDGWETSPYGRAPTNVGYGYLGSLMALDIAVIQSKYGVNEEYATGNDVYVLKDENAAGTYYSSIWDGGGTDEIRYTGAKDSNIDLREASLLYEIGGGGWVSYAWGIHGGFTIAKGAVIENATTGSGNDTLTGNAANNVLTSGAGNDLIKIHLGGNDIVVAGDGVDSIYAGAAFTAADTIDGGANRDALILQGDYSAGVTFGTGTVSNITGIDSLSLVPGSLTTYGDTAGNHYSYNLTMLDGNVAADAVLKVNGYHLRATENLTFNGAAETDGKYEIYGGLGRDLLTGGAQNDIFVFGPDGRFGEVDTVDGGGGYDVVYLRGDYVIDFNAPGYGDSLTNVESIALLTAANTEFVGGGDGELDYVIVANDAMLATGATMTINGSRLGANESFVFEGSQEGGGIFRLFGGAAGDYLNSGGGNDLISGGGGADRLIGNAGADVFRYQSTADSTAAAKDQILDFQTGADKIDLSRIDAIAGTDADDTFTFIGAAAFTAAGQLRATNVSANVWQVEGDTNGDGTADLVIQVTVESGQPLVASDFLL
ncbi:MAG TPA: M10 family metallopeptidase C-terminal domain-containing protein [Allosphingosinicella sp.]|jgi:hypothetical protein